MVPAHVIARHHDRLDLERIASPLAVDLISHAAGLAEQRLRAHPRQRRDDARRSVLDEPIGDAVFAGAFGVRLEEPAVDQVAYQRVALGGVQPEVLAQPLRAYSRAIRRKPMDA